MKPTSAQKSTLAACAVLAAAIGCYFAANHREPPIANAEENSARPDRASRPALPSPAPSGETGADLLSEIRTLAGQGETVDFQMLQSAIQALVKKDAKSAAEWAASLPDGSVREFSLHRVAQAWATRRPEASAEWADSFRNQDLRGMLLHDVFGEVAQTDPAKAIQMVETFSMLSFSPPMTGNLIRQWAIRDYDSASRWSDGQPATATRDEIYRQLAVVRSETSAEDAARMVSEQIRPGSIQDEAAIAIVSRWASTDPEASQEWAETFETADLRERAIREIQLVSAKR